ncbi:hypothetical protein DMENIID0001_041090 [Sergentomyia squamirostris]
MSAKDSRLSPLWRNSPHWMRNEESFPSVAKPRVIGGYSVGEENEFLDSLENLKYLHLPEGDVNWDLNQGYEKYTGMIKETTRIDLLLRFIMKHRDKLRPSENVPGRVLEADFVCFRSVLTELLCTPYEGKKFFKEWTIVASKYRGTIYLYKLQRTQQDEEEKDDRKRRAGYYGYKYQQLITTRDLDTPSDLSGTVIKQPFCVMFQSRFEHHRMLYSGGIDAVLTDDPIDKNADLFETSLKFLDFHTKMANMEERKFMKYKLRQWWCKNFTAGVETVYVGSRTQDGILEKIEAMSVEEMPTISKTEWCASVCMGFLIEFLNLVKFVLKDMNDPASVALFSFNPHISTRVQYEILPEKTEMSFLPEWYVDFIEELCAVGENVPETTEAPEEIPETSEEIPDGVPEEIECCEI